MDLSSMLKILASQDGSDLYLSTAAPARTEDAASWGLELKLEDLEEEGPEEPGGRV
ncbi:hypothetical protein D3C81_2110730 [compost metagenome]